MSIMFEFLSTVTALVCLIGSILALAAFVKIIWRDICDRRDSSSPTEHR